MKKRLLPLFILLLSTGLYVHGQNKRISIPGKNGTIYTGKVDDHYFYFMFGHDNSSCNLMRMDLNTNKYEFIDSNITFCQGVQFTDSGVFYISFNFFSNGNDGQHFLNFYKYNGNPLNLGIINLYTSSSGSRPANISVVGNNYYTVTLHDKLYTLWKSDGSISGTRAMVKTNNPISSYFIFNNEIYFWEYNNAQNLWNLFKTDNNGSKTFLSGSRYPFGTVYQNDSFGFCNFNNKLRRTKDFKYFDSTFQNKFIPQNSILRTDSLLMQVINDVNGSHLEAISLNYPYNYYEVPKAKTPDNAIYRINSINGRFVYIWSLLYGNEIAVYSTDDSMRLVKDLYKDFGSGVRFIFPFDFHTNLNFLGSNGSDDHNYFYQTDGHSIKSFFKVDTISTDDISFIHNNSFYWCYHNSNSDTNFIFTRRLTDKDTQANPPSSFKKNGSNNGREWHREFSAASKFWPNYYQVENEGVHIDRDANIVVNASITDNYHDLSLISLDTSVAKDMNGYKFIIKYNKDGSFLWAKSFNNSKIYNLQNSKTALDENGNVLIFGVFFQKFYFETDSLIAPRAGIYVGKLNKDNGTFLWCKMLNPTFYTDDCDIGNIIADKDGNIYLSLTYKNFRASFGNFNVTADRSPVNAFVKLSPDGEVIWAKNTPTTWEDIYGLTRDVAYNRLENSFYTVISQGYYNWQSSCKYQNWHTSIQKINTNGDILKTQDFECDDLYSSVCAELTQNNELFISGFYRGILTSDKYKVESKFNSKYGCEQIENFTAKFNLSKLDGIGLKSTDNSEFYPVDAAKDKEFIYVIGSELTNASKYQKRNLCIRKYNHSGRLLAKRLFDRAIYDVFDFDFFYNIDADDSSIVMSMNSARKISPYLNYFGNSGGISVYRLDKTIGWQTINEYEKRDLENNMIISPNPATDFINIQFFDAGIYKSMEIIDDQGKSIRHLSLTDDTYQSIDISDLASGIYIIHFSGSENRSFKVIKL